ncbi:hypothetical protein DQ04_00051200 [Trypanosoma grayi]|uniref:hypothetical protein n=1 Tax=Trypanosoma grayi TaxID=71804 RepID=UPI0004F42D83|nr:hypothetical protein DQ04_00051200 [Trypanosoma grayi]KEG15525.1 hypothetical protein DQ04_00051200 [Trypanosoma grayi]
MPQSYLPSLNPLQPPPTPVVFQTSNACGGGLPAASEALPSGILRRSCEQQQQPGRIVVLGVNPPAAAAQGLLSPTLLSADFGELSAEPSKFIGPVPFVK